jgi:hypothetical protein
LGQGRALPTELLPQRNVTFVTCDCKDTFLFRDDKILNGKIIE